MSVPCSYANGQEAASSSSLKAVITHVAPEQKWVKLYVQKDYDSVTAIESYLELNESALCKQSGFLHQGQLPLGIPCFARFTDNKWYRAAVSAWPKSDTTFVEVTFIDYGNPEIVSVADIRRGDESIFHTPPLAMECFLDGVDVFQLSPKDASEIIEYIKDTLLYEEVTLYVLRHEQVQDDCVRPIVSVILPTGDNLVKTLSGNPHSGGSGDDDMPRYQVPTFKYPVVPLGSTAQVYISHTNSMDDFYVHLSTRDPTEFTERIQKYCAVNRPSPLPAVSEGMACMARFSEDSHFYRSSVLSVGGKGCTVLFVDYGNAEAKAPGDIFAIPAPFLDEPVYALHCSVTNSPVDVGTFRDVTADAAMACKFISRCGPTKYAVEFPSLGAPSVPMGIGRLHFEPGSVCTMYISYIESAEVMYGQVKDMTGEIEEIAQTLAAENQSVPPETADPRPGTAVLCRYEGTWYRAEVIESTQKVTAWIADYGDTVVVDRSDVRLLDPKYLLRPACAVKLTLDGYKCHPANLEAVTATLQNLVLDVETKVQIVESLPDGLHVVRMFVGNPPASVVKMLTATKDDVEVPRPTLAATERMTVVTVTPPRSFFGQLSRFPVEELDALQDSLAKHYAAVEPDPTFRPVSGQHVCCTFSEDGLLYRAKVLSIEHAGHYGVFYLDFGNEEIVPLENIRPLAAQFATWPQFGIRCCLDPSTRGVDVSALADTEVEVRPLREEGDFHVVSLVGPPPRAGAAPPVIAQTAPPEPVVSPQMAAFTPAGLAVGRKTAVDVVFVVSPEEFYCQSKAEEAELNALMDAIAAVEVQAPLAFPQLKVNMPCVARYSEDQGWYRAKVRRLMGASAEVFFVDYGNVEVVNCGDLRALPAEHLQLPAQAVRCRLADVVPDGGGAWPRPTAIRFDTLVSAEAVTADVLSQNPADGCYDIELTLPSRECVGSLLVREGLARFRGNPVAQNAVEQGFQYQSLPVGTPMEVAVAWVLNPGEVFLQRTDSAEKLDRLMEELQAHYANSAVDREPVRAGQACVAKFSEDCMWYRARVTHSKGSKLGVHYVDYGNCEEVTEADVRKIAPRFLELPAQAVRCRIRGASPPGSSWPVVDSGGPLDEILAGILRCRASADSDGVHLVDLERPSDGASVAELLVVAGLSRPAEAGGGSTSEASLSSKPKMCIPPAELSFQSGQYVDVKVTAALSAEEVWCCVLNASDPIAEALTKEASSSKKLANPGSGEACVACSRDGEWGRAVVRSRVSPAKIKVYFVDLGVVQTVHHAEVKPITPELTELPAQAFRCSLVCAGRTMGPDALKCIVGKELVLEVKAVHDGRVEGQLYDTSGKDEVNVLDIVAPPSEEVEPPPESVGAVVPVAPAAGDAAVPKKEDSHPLHKPPPHRGREPGGHVIVPCYAPLSKITGKMAAYVTHVEGLSCFYVLRKDQEADLEALSDRLQEHYGAGGGEPVVPVPKLPCIAVFCDDSLWYRARVVCPLDDSRARVHFVDYGNTAEATEMRSVDSEFLEVPPFCYKCKLEGAKELSRIPDACNRFGSLVADAELEMHVVTWGHEVTVRLVKGGVDIAEELSKSEAGSTPVGTTEQQMRVLPVEGEVLCSITHIDRVDSFYACPAEKEDALADFVSQLQEALSAENAVVESPKVGMPCAALFSEDGQWYRATVLEVGESLKVLFVDYGNSETVESVVELPGTFLDFPAYSFQCRLEGVDHDDAILETFRKLTGEEHILVRVVEWGQPAVVRLFTNGGSDVAARLKLGSAVPAEDVPEGGAETKGYTHPAVALHQKTQVTVCHIINPVDFYVHLDDLAANLDEIAVVLEEPPAQDGEFVPTAGLRCTALYSDGVAYRATVVEVSGEEAKVFFVDYGNTESVGIKDLSPLPANLCSIPALAVHCRLDVDVEQASDAQVIEKFCELAEDKSFLADFLREDEGAYLVRLLDMGIDISSSIVGKKGDVADELSGAGSTLPDGEAAEVRNATDDTQDSVFYKQIEKVSVEGSAAGGGDTLSLSASEASPTEETSLEPEVLKRCEEDVDESTVPVDKGDREASEKVVREPTVETSTDERVVEDRTCAEEPTDEIVAVVNEEQIETNTDEARYGPGSSESAAGPPDLGSEVWCTEEEPKREAEEVSSNTVEDRLTAYGGGTDALDATPGSAGGATEGLSPETSVEAVLEPKDALRDTVGQVHAGAAIEVPGADGAVEGLTVYGPAEEESVGDTRENPTSGYDPGDGCQTDVPEEDVAANEQKAERSESRPAASKVAVEPTMPEEVGVAEAHESRVEESGGDPPSERTAEVAPAETSVAADTSSCTSACDGGRGESSKAGEADAASAAEEFPPSSPGGGEPSAPSSVAPARKRKSLGDCVVPEVCSNSDAL